MSLSLMHPNTQKYDVYTLAHKKTFASRHSMPLTKKKKKSIPLLKTLNL